MNDAEILSRIDASREKLKLDLEQELTALFKKERDALLERAHLFMTVGKWSAAALAIGFGLLGIKAWTDVSTHVEDYFKGKLEKAYRLEDPSSPLSRSLDQLMDRAVINALYVQLQRSRLPTDDRQFLSARERDVLTTNELERLIRIVRSPQTGTAAFEDTVLVLSQLATSDEHRQTAASALAELLAAKPNSDASWAAANEKKRLAVLASFRSAEAVDAVASDLLSQAVSERLKAAALQRLRREDYKASLPNVLKLTEATGEPRLRLEALRTLARLRPDHERTKTFIVTELLKATDKNSLLHCLDIASELAAGAGERTFFPDEEERQRRRNMLSELAVPLVAKAFEAGATLSYEDFGLRRGLRSSIRTGDNSFRLGTVGKEIYSDEIVSPLLSLGANKSINTLRQYVAALSPTSMRSPDSKVRIFAILEPGSEVLLADGSSLASGQAKNARVQLVAPGRPDASRRPAQLIGTQAPAQGTPLLLGVWEDGGGMKVQKPVAGIKNARFRAEVKFSRNDDQDDE